VLHKTGARGAPSNLSGDSMTREEWIEQLRDSVLHVARRRSPMWLRLAETVVKLAGAPRPEVVEYCLDGLLNAAIFTETARRSQLQGLADSLHGHVTGISDSLQPEDLKNTVEELLHRISHWRPSSSPRVERYDNAVKELCLASLEEYNLTREGGPDTADILLFVDQLHHSVVACGVGFPSPRDKFLHNFLEEWVSSVRDETRTPYVYYHGLVKEFCRTVLSEYWKATRDPKGEC